ncbi:DUF2336 domain-containing protein [Devosia sp. MC1541]|uniref:DUF2336 domain-containing protein n=1 Tax=Devosia sp. MC1541 TaxID=2725264 RepID=UPI00145FC1F5|nr:DUF2336 domain-containing protein [Devosia sp. MC1541]
MVGYQAFAELCQSADSDARGHAAHLAALAYLDHRGHAEEHAALYAALIGFLDDPSVKVRAALAFGLLHADTAPRPVILSLLGDSPVISRAVLQYSPVLIDADLAPLIRRGEISDLLAIAQRRSISARLAGMMLEAEQREVSLLLLRRLEVAAPAEVLLALAMRHSGDPQVRGALLARHDLPAQGRLILIRAVAEGLKSCRVVKGSLPSGRLNKILRDSLDTAISVIGEASDGDTRYVDDLAVSENLNTRTLLHALVNGRVLFFCDCIGHLAGVKTEKVFSVLNSGGRATVAALFARAGLAPSVVGLMVRFIQHARMTDLSDDVSARHYVVTALTEELLAEYSNDIPFELEEAFGYLSEQNITLARQAARGVVSAFAEHRMGAFALPAPAEERIALPAA